MRIPSRSHALGLILVLVLTACGGGPGPGETGAEAPTTLEVDNRSNFDMTVYALSESGARTRLGMVTAHTTMELEIPSRLIFGISEMRFQADPVGATAEPVTQSISIQAGDTVVMTIPPF